MNELDSLFKELFPEQINSKTLRLKRAMHEHFLRAIKELSKQRIPESQAIQMTLENLGGSNKVKKLIQRSNRRFPLLTTPYAIIMISLMAGYPLVLWLAFLLFDIDSFPLYIMLPALIGIGMFVSKVYVAVFEIQSNKFDLVHELSNASVLAGAGMRYQEPKETKEA